jgi:hypothetical protein
MVGRVGLGPGIVLQVVQRTGAIAATRLGFARRDPSHGERYKRRGEEEHAPAATGSHERPTRPRLTAPQPRKRPVGGLWSPNLKSSGKQNLPKSYLPRRQFATEFSEF